MTPLRQRMLDALVLRGKAVRTQEAYIDAVVRMSGHFGRSPDTLSSQQVQRYLLHLLRERKLARSSVNQWDVADGLQQSVVVEPRDPLERRQFDRFACLPRRATMDQLGLVQPVDRLGQRVVVAVADAAHRGLDAGFGQPFAVADRDVLRAPDALLYVKWRFGSC